MTAAMQHAVAGIPLERDREGDGRTAVARTTRRARTTREPRRGGRVVTGDTRLQRSSGGGLPARRWSARTQTDRTQAEAPVVYLGGEFDIETAPEIDSFLRRTFGPFYFRRDLVLDLSAVTFADSAFLGCIIGLLRLLQREGRELVLTRPAGQVRTLIGVVGLANVVPVFDEVDAAGDALSHKTAPLIPPPFAWSARPVAATP
jgi:anti-sigma B factor antagonist